VTVRFSCDRDSDFHARDIAMENQVNVITHTKITSKFNLLSAQASRKTLQAQAANFKPSPSRNHSLIMMTAARLGFRVGHSDVKIELANSRFSGYWQVQSSWVEVIKIKTSMA
jgi:hypothetical protein